MTWMLTKSGKCIAPAFNDFGRRCVHNWPVSSDPTQLFKKTMTSISLSIRNHTCSQFLVVSHYRTTQLPHGERLRIPTARRRAFAHNTPRAAPRADKILDARHERSWTSSSRDRLPARRWNSWENLVRDWRGGACVCVSFSCGEDMLVGCGSLVGG